METLILGWYILIETESALLVAAVGALRFGGTLISPLVGVVADRLARRTLKKLFGRPVGGFGSQPFAIEGRALIFIDADPGGDACHLLSGFAEEVLERTVGGSAEVTHTLCQGRGDDLCRWEGTMVAEALTVDLQGVGEDDDEV